MWTLNSFKYGICGAVSFTSINILYRFNQKQKDEIYKHPIIDVIDCMRDGIIGFWSGMTLYSLSYFFYYNKNYLKQIGSSQ